MIIRTILITYITWIVLWTSNVLAAPAVDQKKPNPAKLYTDHCAICHGDKGDGNTRVQNGLNPPPRDFTTVQAAMELNRPRMIHSVTNGRPGTGMMPHRDRLSEIEIAAVVDYVRAEFMRTPVAAPASPVNAEGARIYGKYCSVCHGDKGNSAVWARSQMKPPPRDFTSTEAASLLTRERMIHSVTNGRPGTGMMSFTTKLNASEIEAVVDYIRASFIAKAGQSIDLIAQNPVSRMDPHQRNPRTNPHQRSNPHQRPDPHQRTNPHQAGTGAHPGMPMSPQGSLPRAIPADMSLPMPKGLKGNINRGRAFFMKNCFTCHGVKGDGEGPRAYFNIPRPRNFTSEVSRRMLNRVRLFNGIANGRVGTVMPAWNKVLTDQQIADVAEFVFQTFIKTKDAKKKAK